MLQCELFGRILILDIERYVGHQIIRDICCHCISSMLLNSITNKYKLVLN